MAVNRSAALAEVTAITLLQYHKETATVLPHSLFRHKYPEETATVLHRPGATMDRQRVTVMALHKEAVLDRLPLEMGDSAVKTEASTRAVRKNL